MDPFTLLFLAVFVYGTGDAVRGVRARVANRADRIEARRRPPRADRTAASADSGTARQPRTADTHSRHLHAPRRAARFGSRLAAAAFTYPALTWMLPASFYRGWRHGRLVGKHWRRSGGDVETAKRRAAEHAEARGWHIPDWARPGRPEPAPRKTNRGRRVVPPNPNRRADTVPAVPGAAPTTDTAAPATIPNPADAGTAQAPQNDTPAATVEPTPSATPGAVLDAEIVSGPSPTADPFDDIVNAYYDQGQKHPAATATKGPSPMSDLIPAPAALFENGDYEALEALGTHGQQLGEHLEEEAAELGALLNSFSNAAENAAAESASMRVDAATQSDIAEFQTCLAEFKTEHARLIALAEAVTEAATALKRNLEARHGAIHDAVQDAPVSHAANSDFYGKSAQ